eukprot:gene23813-9376_t
MAMPVDMCKEETFDGTTPRYRYDTMGLELPWSLKQRKEHKKHHNMAPPGSSPYEVPLAAPTMQGDNMGGVGVCTVSPTMQGDNIGAVRACTAAPTMQWGNMRAAGACTVAASKGAEAGRGAKASDKEAMAPPPSVCFSKHWKVTAKACSLGIATRGVFKSFTSKGKSASLTAAPESFSLQVACPPPKHPSDADRDGIAAGQTGDSDPSKEQQQHQEMLQKQQTRMQQRRRHVPTQAGSGASGSGAQVGGEGRSNGEEVAHGHLGVYRYSEGGDTAYEQDTATSQGEPVTCLSALKTEMPAGVPSSMAIMHSRLKSNAAAAVQVQVNSQSNGTGTSNESGSLEGSVQGSNEPGTDAPAPSNPKQRGAKLLSKGSLPSMQEPSWLAQVGVKRSSSYSPTKDGPGMMMMIDERDGNNVVPEGGPRMLSSGQVGVKRSSDQIASPGHTPSAAGQALVPKEEGLVPKEEGDNDYGDEGGLQLPTGPAASTDAYVGKQAQGSSGGHESSNEPGEMGSAPHEDLVSNGGGSSSNGNNRISATFNGGVAVAAENVKGALLSDNYVPQEGGERCERSTQHATQRMLGAFQAPRDLDRNHRDLEANPGVEDERGSEQRSKHGKRPFSEI